MCFCRKSPTAQDDELPEVTVNMVDKGKSTRNFNPRHLSDISQRITRLRSGTVRQRDYQRMNQGLSSDDEVSDANSAVASDKTVSSLGQSREVLMISTEEVTKMVEDALAKQKENFKFEMEMIMMRMREEHDQQIRVLSNQVRLESSRRTQNAVIDSDPEVDEIIIVDAPPKNTGCGSNAPPTDNDAGGGPHQ